MTFVATPDPNDTPPSVELDYTLDTPGSITSFTVTRNGEELRFNTVPSGNQIILTDYEAQFGILLAYVITGEFLPDSLPDWTESWASDAAWSGDTGDWSTAGGEASSSVSGADISRSASGTIQKIEVADPNYVEVQLLTTGDVLVATITFTTEVLLEGNSSSSTAGDGSFTATLLDGTITATADDDSWTLTDTYVGTPTQVRFVSHSLAALDLIDSFGTFGTGSGQFQYVNGVAQDAAGNVWAVDYGNNRVQKYDSDGNYLTSIGSTGTTNGKFIHPWDIAFDSAGNFFVTDSTNDRVQKFDSNGNYVSQFGTSGGGDGQFSDPSGIVIDGSDNIFVVDRGHSRVQKFNSAGTYQSQFGTFGSGDGQFSQPVGIALDAAANIYTTEWGNDRVQKFNSAGVYQSKFGTFGTGNGQFEDPYAIVVDASGNIWVVDNGNDRVQKFDSAGTYQTQFGNALFNRPVGIALDNNGNLLVGDDGHVYTFTAAAIPATVGETSVYLPVTTEQFAESVETQLDAEDAWLIHPFNTDLSLNIGRDTGCAAEGIEVSPETKRTSVAQTRSVLLNPVGRTRWIAITQQDRMIGTWDLVLLTESYADRDSIVNFLAADVPFLLRSPASFGWDLPDDWYSVGDVADNRETYQMGALECGHPYNKLTLPLYPVDPPAEPVPPNWTYGQDLLLYPTYQDSLDAQPTYLDRLVGPSV